MNDIPNAKIAFDIEACAEAIMTLTVWLAQSHVFGQEDVDKMGEILKPLLPITPATRK